MLRDYIGNPAMNRLPIEPQHKAVPPVEPISQIHALLSDRELLVVDMTQTVAARMTAALS